MASVAKIIVVVQSIDGCRFLMSRKNSTGNKHDKLEFLGGRLNQGESPAGALVRELAEEERSGLLAAAVRGLAPWREVIAGGDRQYLFVKPVENLIMERLKPAPLESLGFVLLPADDLKPSTRLTPKTNQILEALALNQELRDSLCDCS